MDATLSTTLLWATRFTFLGTSLALFFMYRLAAAALQ
ncbi:hypothetical protein M002_27625 [Pseudomonas aeruginosa ID4365]|nr:hypothetical protein M002_27625 [Pseudomonas aeruginosa ID4365]